MYANINISPWTYKYVRIHNSYIFMKILDQAALKLLARSQWKDQ